MFSLIMKFNNRININHKNLTKSTIYIRLKFENVIRDVFFSLVTNICGRISLGFFCAKKFPASGVVYSNALSVHYYFCLNIIASRLTLFSKCLDKMYHAISMINVQCTNAALVFSVCETLSSKYYHIHQ